jgi:hypothetical protein
MVSQSAHIIRITLPGRKEKIEDRESRIATAGRMEDSDCEARSSILDLSSGTPGEGS